MRKTIALLLFFTAVLTTQAQIVQFGITGDMAFIKEESSKNSWDTKQFKPDKGWSAGIKVKFSSALGLGADIGLKFVKEDMCYSFYIPNPADSSTASEADMVSESIDDNVSFVSIPINLRYELKLPLVSKVVYPYAFAGPEFCYTLKGFDWEENDLEYAQDYFKEQKAQWNLNFGFGVLLFKHLEVAYTHTSHISDCLEIDNKFKVGSELSKRFKNHTNKIAMTIYF